jgi:hypothetical protein
MTFHVKPREEAASYLIGKLPLNLQSYAKEWWSYLEHPGGAQPRPDEFGLTYSQAQHCRLALAALS